MTWWSHSSDDAGAAKHGAASGWWSPVDGNDLDVDQLGYVGISRGVCDVLWRAVGRGDNRTARQDGQTSDLPCNPAGIKVLFGCRRAAWVSGNNEFAHLGERLPLRTWGTLIRYSRGYLDEFQSRCMLETAVPFGRNLICVGCERPRKGEVGPLCRKSIKSRGTRLAQRIDLLHQPWGDVAKQMSDLHWGPCFVEARPRDPAQELELARREQNAPDVLPVADVLRNANDLEWANEGAEFACSAGPDDVLMPIY